MSKHKWSPQFSDYTKADFLDVQVIKIVQHVGRQTKLLITKDSDIK